MTPHPHLHYRPVPFILALALICWAIALGLAWLAMTAAPYLVMVGGLLR